MSVDSLVSPSSIAIRAHMTARVDSKFDLSTLLASLPVHVPDVSDFTIPQSPPPLVWDDYVPLTSDEPATDSDAPHAPEDPLAAFALAFTLGALPTTSSAPPDVSLISALPSSTLSTSTPTAVPSSSAIPVVTPTRIPSPIVYTRSPYQPRPTRSEIKATQTLTQVCTSPLAPRVVDSEETDSDDIIAYNPHSDSDFGHDDSKATDGSEEDDED